MKHYITTVGFEKKNYQFTIYLCENELNSN